MEKRMLMANENQELWKQCDWDFHHALISACDRRASWAHAAGDDAIFAIR